MYKVNTGTNKMSYRQATSVVYEYLIMKEL